jgi:hypothetical protein
MDFSTYDQRPIVIAIAGPNGAGKSTSYRAHLAVVASLLQCLEACFHQGGAMLLPACSATLRVSLLLAVAGFAQAAFAQEKSPGTTRQTASVYSDAMQRAKEGNYLAALRLLDSAAPPEKAGSPRLQVKAWLLNAVGKYAEAQRAFNDSGALVQPPFTEPSAADLQKIEGVPLTPAEDFILAAFATHRVVILNEAHHQPEGRALGARIVPRLPALGVKYFALETGNQEPLDEAVKTGKVTTVTDPYSWDPQRAALLRAVLSSGLKPVAIDIHANESTRMPVDAAGRLDFRENAMARHLQRILEKEPDAKILVWVGFSHALKTPQGKAGTLWMAARFWKNTGVEPYCIYQMSDAGEPAYQYPIYRLTVTAAGREVKAPMAFGLPVTSFAGTMPATVLDHPLYAALAKLGADAVVLHPRARPTSAVCRPGWLERGGSAEIHGRIRSERADGSGYLVQALPSEAAENDRTLVPIDQVITAHDGAYVLRVPAGKFKIRVATLTEGASDDKLVAVTAAEAHAEGQKSRRDVTVPAGSR